MNVKVDPCFAAGVLFEGIDILVLLQRIIKIIQHFILHLCTHLMYLIKVKWIWAHWIRHKIDFALGKVSL